MNTRRFLGEGASEPRMAAMLADAYGFLNRGQRTTHWCFPCLLPAFGPRFPLIAYRIWRVMMTNRPLRMRIVGHVRQKDLDIPEATPIIQEKISTGVAGLFWQISIAPRPFPLRSSP